MYAIGRASLHDIMRSKMDDSHFELYRRLLPNAIGPGGAWQAWNGWNHAFNEVFGLSVQQMYGGLQTNVQQSTGVRRRGPSDAPALAGTITSDDGEPNGRVRVTLFDVATGYRQFQWASADGAFAFTVQAGGRYMLAADLGDPPCRGWYSEDRMLGRVEDATVVNIVGLGLQSVELQVPRHLCTPLVDGLLISSEGDPFAGVLIDAVSSHSEVVRVLEGFIGPEPQSQVRDTFTRNVTDGRFIWASASTYSASGGYFRLALPPESSVRLLVRLRHDCVVELFPDGSVLVPDRSIGWNTSPFHVRRPGPQLDSMKFTVGEHLRPLASSSHVTGTFPAVKGRLLDAEGKPIANAAVTAFRDGRVPAGTHATKNDGLFELGVGEAGSYHVRAMVDGCIVYYQQGRATGDWRQATDIQVRHADVNGVDIRLPEGMCEYRISGKLFNSDGTPRSGQWVSASGGVGSGGASTARDGSFSFVVPKTGGYILSVWIDNCLIYRGSRGPVKNWNSASQVRVSNADVTGIEFRLPEDPASFCN